MAEENLPDSTGEMNMGGAYPMFFGVSCAFLALQFLSAIDGGELGHQKSGFAEIMLRGSAQLLGVMFEKAQKIHEDLREKERIALLEVMELKRIRADEAKANEKVMSIFSTRERTWQAEIRRLLNQIHCLSSELSSAKSKIEEMVSEMKGKDEFFEEQSKKIEVLEIEMEEVRERGDKELRRHKAAFAELVSDQRRLEAELEEALEQKEEAMAVVESLSEEFVRLQKDADQKGKIVSAMIRKAKHDTAEKKALLKEVTITRAKKKQAEMEGERWRNMCESSKQQRKNSSEEAGTSGKRSTELNSTARIDLRARLLMYLDKESNGGQSELLQEQRLIGNDDNLEIQDWVRVETKKYTAILEEKHYLEIEAFAEQLRIRDEKLDDLHWRLLSTELDSKTLQSHIEGLDGSLAQLTDDNLKLETLLEDRERDLNSLTARPSFHGGHFTASNGQHPPPVFDLLMKSATKKSRDVQNMFEVERNLQEKHEVKEGEEIVLVTTQFKPGMEVGMTVGIGSFPSSNLSDDQSNDGDSSEHQLTSVRAASRLAEEEVGEEEQRQVHTRQNSMEIAFASVSSKNRASDAQPMLKMNIQALGVSFKIKRVGQQLLTLENLAAGDDETGSNCDKKPELKGLKQVISFLNKQLKRYQALEERTDTLCRRMLENSGSGASRLHSDAGEEEKSSELEKFLEGTFQLQRFVVATGQKLMELQPRIKGSLVGGEEEDWRSRFNLGQFLDVVRNLFMEVQSGLEVRIARIIGDIEGTLASDGILRR